MTKLELLRHYIFIDPSNINADIHECELLNEIKNEYYKHYINDEKIIYWSYYDIANLLKQYDSVLHSLFLQLNVQYPALLADIGRYVILYFYGGVYGDLKCISNKEMIIFLKKMLSKGIELIGETHPKHTHRVRNTNIIALCKEHELLNETLQSVKYALLDARKNNLEGPNNVWHIGSKIYIDLFQKHKGSRVIDVPLQVEGYLLFDGNIYSSRINKWQSTYEPLFGNKTPKNV